MISDRRFIFYREILNFREILGGVIILVSVILMNFIIKREDRDAKVAEAPFGA